MHTTNRVLVARRETDGWQRRRTSSRLTDISRPRALFTALNLATLAFVIAYLAFDWWAIGYLVSH